jgi:mono/diheme cytochrome c family protein
MNGHRRSGVTGRTLSRALTGVAGLLWSIALASLGLAHVGAHAGAHPDGKRQLGAPLLPAYVQECGACHTPYAPALLPARSWDRVMTGLERHYGTDATLDPALRAALARWLQAQAGTGKRAAEEPPADRITRSAWFVRKHRKVDPAVWQLPSVRTPAQCAACHGGADQGRFNERELGVPAGVDTRQRRAWQD